jgi:hypothetical protein
VSPEILRLFVVGAVGAVMILLLKLSVEYCTVYEAAFDTAVHVKFTIENPLVASVDAFRSVMVPDVLKSVERRLVIVAT